MYVLKDLFTVKISVSNNIFASRISSRSIPYFRAGTLTVNPAVRLFHRFVISWNSVD